MGCSGSKQFSQNKFNKYKSNKNIKQGQSEQILDPFNPHIKRKIQLGQIISQEENLSCYTKINNRNCLSLEKIREEDEFEDDEEEKKNYNKDQNQALELRLSKSLEGQYNLENKRNKIYKKKLYFSNNKLNQLHNFSNPQLGRKFNSDSYNSNLLKDFKYFYVYQNSIHQQNKQEQNNKKQNIIKEIKITRPRMTSFERFKIDSNQILDEPTKKNSDASLWKLREFFNHQLR
ncbi:hypothetical protein PPERSA_04227 [Pseudocohnilembus persalinus]|uniref:Uncharacterized protein n=1 Tax=Pseudocohnilembus persalinus TaxID=266149 RepID=A0A0V0QNH3_PSEPJ|nr:hypothetical protein PPERSA_04227 [Pseudocohnilembus persalinus]|eukprot:KRX03719.1 hypothetical protein PPERSA_04227 [Pseudocohnilembus persalinus]